MALVSPA